MINAIKAGLFRGLVIFVIFAIPVFGIKWGAAHRDFSWTHLLQKAAAVHFSPDSMIWSQAFSFTMPWQEKAAIVVSTFFAVYIFFQLRLHTGSDEKSISKKQSWQRPEDILNWGSHAFLFLYVAACALCERTNLGELDVEYDFTSYYRDFGLTVLVVVMLFLSRFLIKQASFNGMVTRDDYTRSYRYLVAVLAALPMCFAAWLPLFAIPGVLIMIRFAFERIKEVDYQRGQIPDSEYANCDEAE